MADFQPLMLSPAQVLVLEKLLKSGFKFVTFERYARYPAVEKEGFVALLDAAEGKIRMLGQVGYRVGEEIAMLTEHGGAKAFVCHGTIVAASADLLAAYTRVKNELEELLGTSAQ